MVILRQTGSSFNATYSLLSFLWLQVPGAIPAILTPRHTSFSAIFDWGITWLFWREIYGDPTFFGSGLGFVNRMQSDPGFVNPVQSSPGFVNTHIFVLFNNTWTLRLKAQLTNAFFIAANQVFGASSQRMTTATIWSPHTRQQSKAGRSWWTFDWR